MNGKQETIELKEIKFSNKMIESCLKGIMNVLKEKRDKGEIENYITEKTGMLDLESYLWDIRDNQNFKHIIDFLFKNDELKEHYTEETMKEIIINSLAKRICEKKSIELGDTDIKDVASLVKEEIVNLKKEQYIYQVIYLKYEGEDITIGPCTLTTFNEPKKVYHTPLDELIPGIDPLYKNFIIVSVWGNDSKIDRPQSLNLARNFVDILKLYNQNSPLIRLHDTCFRPYKDGLCLAYQNSEVFHWDLQLKEKEEFEKFINNFKEIFENNKKYESTISALNRFSYALTIPTLSFQIAEIIGCMETLLTNRGQTNIANLLVRRICSLCQDADIPRLQKIIKEYYDERSDYFHQSKSEKVNNNPNMIKFIFTGVIIEFTRRLDRYESKKDLLRGLDSENKMPQDKNQK